MYVNNYFNSSNRQFNNFYNLNVLMPLMLILIVILTGCYADGRNLTPSEFPFITIYDTPPPPHDESNYYHLPETPNRLLDLDENAPQIFLLETKRKNVTNLKCYLHLNESSYLMTLDPEHNDLWTWVPPQVLMETASYYFKMKYKRGLYGNTTKYIGTSSEPFTVTPVGYGFAAIISPEWHRHAVDTSTDPVTIVERRYMGPLRIWVQSLCGDELHVSQVKLIDYQGQPNDNNKFIITDLPSSATGNPPGYSIGSGNKMEFKIYANAPHNSGGTLYAFLQIVISSQHETRTEILRIKSTQGPS